MNDSIESMVRDKIRAAASYAALRRAVYRHIAYLHGKYRAAERMSEIDERPELMLGAHASVWDARGHRAKTMKSLADAVFRETGLPRTKPGLFRGDNYRIDWDTLNDSR